MVKQVAMQLKAVKQFKKIINDKPRALPGPRPVHSSLAHLDTPIESTCYERSRDVTLNALNTKFMEIFTICFIVAVIVVGAAFFFILIGAVPLKKPEPRNEVFNVSVQCLTGLITWPAVISLPWRISNLIHIKCTHRNNLPGHDFYGKPTDSIWFHIPTGPRLCIVYLLISNSLTQFCNQASRIVFFSHEEAESWPGALFVNLFFFGGFAPAIGAAWYQWRQEEILRKEHPDRFHPGPVEYIKHKWEMHKHRVGYKKKEKEKSRKALEAGAAVSQESSTDIGCGVVVSSTGEDPGDGEAGSGTADKV